MSKGDTSASAPARAASLRPQPASQSSQSAIPIAKGRAFLLKIEAGEVFQTVAGLRETAHIIAGDAIAVAGKGIFLSGGAEAAIRHRALSGSVDSYELSYESGERLRGQFQVQRLAYIGDFNGERNFEVSLMGTAAPHPPQSEQPEQSQ